MSVALYTMQWMERAEPARSQASAGDLWCIFLDESGVGQRVLDFARAAGHRCLGLRRGSARGTGGGGTLGVPSGTRSEFRRSVAGALQSGGHVNVVYLWALDAFGRCDAEAEALACARVADLVSVLAVDAEVSSSSLWLVTRGGQAAGESRAVAGLQPAAWGLGRCIRFEHPELSCRRLDLDPDETDPRLDALRVFSEASRAEVGSGEDEVAFRGARRCVPRLRELEVSARAPRSFSPRPDATYLVTGGLGLLGLRLLEWLGAHRARHVDVVARRGPTLRAQRLIDALRDAGTRIELHQADVSEARAVTELIDAVAASDRPLRGIFHLAGDFGDSDILDLPEAELQTVMAGRAHGALHLDLATRGIELETFVMFGSSVAALGAPGQAAFAASNAVLSSVVAERQRLGHPAVCVLWGPWAYGILDGGGALVGLEAGEALETLAQLAAGASGEVMVLPQKLDKLLAFYPRAGSIAAFSGLVDAQQVPDPGYTRRETAHAYQAPRDRVERVVISVVRRMLALDRVGVHDDFFELGGDSVTGAAILDRVNRLLGTSITFEDAIEAFTAEQLAARARVQLHLQAEPNTPTCSPAREAAVGAGR